jgi:hypothetical protein
MYVVVIVLMNILLSVFIMKTSSSSRNAFNPVFMQGEIRLQFQGSQCGIYGGQSGTGADSFFKHCRFPLPISIPPTAGARRFI